MKEADRLRLLFGPYKTPRCRMGQVVRCQVRGKVTICGLTDAPIPWPIGKRGRARMLVIYKDLAKAVRRESEIAVAHWWGITAQSVWKWRRGLGVPATTRGTSRLRREYFEEDWAQEAREKAQAKARDPERRAKIAAAKKGKPRPRHVVKAMVAAHRGKRLSDETRRRMSEAHRRRGTKAPAAGPAWTAREDALLGKLPDAEVARRTRRTLNAVQCRRQTLRITKHGSRGRGFAVARNGAT